MFACKLSVLSKSIVWLIVTAKSITTFFNFVEVAFLAINSTILSLYNSSIIIFLNTSGQWSDLIKFSLIKLAFKKACFVCSYFFCCFSSWL